MRANIISFIWYLFLCGYKLKEKKNTHKKKKHEKMQSVAKQLNDQQERKENARPPVHILVGSTFHRTGRFLLLWQHVCLQCFLQRKPKASILFRMPSSIKIIVFKQATISIPNCNTYENRKGGPTTSAGFPFLFSQWIFLQDNIKRNHRQPQTCCFRLNILYKESSLSGMWFCPIQTTKEKTQLHDLLRINTGSYV